MPLTDSYGQNISYPTLSDKPNAQTMGDGIVNGLTPRSVMRFASSSVRGATLTAPVEGMVTWLQDVNLLQVYDGSAWVTVAAGTQAWTTVPLASGWSHNGNSNGTWQYRVVNLFGEPTIMFRGGITKDSWAGTVLDNYVLTSTPLPASARPVTLRTIVIPCSDSGSTRITMKLDIQTDGHLHLYGTGTNDKPAWFGFNGTFTSL
ncbi:hypothetical protein [Streptomyces chattanoogensis]|uniref:hypothetical protein n=1 Tax=Streptomyces chattanoogensis TaxID=66876 RepID=UPI003699CDA3